MSCKRRITGSGSRNKRAELAKQHSIFVTQERKKNLKGAAHSYGPSDRSTFGEGSPPRGHYKGLLWTAVVTLHGSRPRELHASYLGHYVRALVRYLQLPMVQAQLAPVCVREKSWRLSRSM